ncbi:O-acetylhomoserine aminocarboxypropyltransferase/cysteine synthase family protein [Thermoanaerobacterium thermosaccharolyticum]|uniref:O-acetylhomoserine aminocarboxypropyltransferase/cysteine synthase family protein n=1 Tax=Thermoanaerobacterium thermosaccharolyticum TaxID=1517 RepID=UPI0017841F59|nr:O-acetylhomoserine aminocarboxypropyltransferase/cysteine synthase family protein [Thermoanaerobacterium thermosaccharolyticum]MBE0069415.1 O-acetylhomoserine aminocarboxypropyltransferase/cysteine synthase [Thermoanaerobacterium thermosaccharolyticum]MBE0228248.1 O-acetylhomoserine aminocarboxypropyltransferase/cysteine synthase [Thermoanaerobacterium thermosaccharolyticum]
MRFNTMLLHLNYGPDEKTGASLTPIYQSTSFSHSAEELENIFKGSEYGFTYTRINNPTIEAFERRIASLESGIGAVACSSGMAAITLAILNILKTGDEILSSSGIFGGTYELFKDFENFGITVKFTKDNSIDAFKESITNNTKLIYIETIGNPKLDVPDIKSLSVLAHENKIPLIVDNTVTTPYLIRPIEMGADIVIHSTSKFINGHGNSIGGIIVDSGKFNWDFNKYSMLKKFEKYGQFAYLAKLRKGLFRNIGACMSPFNAYFNNLGLETLGIRMERLCQNAYELAVFLKEFDKVLSVNYPGLKESPFHDIAKRQFGDKFGAILTIRVGSKEKAYKMINSLKYATNITNIGDTRTLIIHPSSTILAESSDEEKKFMGVFDDLIRICVGLEDIEDLKEDFKQAIDRL